MEKYGSNLYFIDQYNFYMTVLEVIHFIFQTWILFSKFYNSISFVGKSHYIRIYVFKFILTICEYDNVLLYSLALSAFMFQSLMFWATAPR